MDLFTLAAFDFSRVGTALLVVLLVIISLLLVLTVLIQRPQGGGLSGAFGSGAGSGQTAFGAKTGDALTVATIIMFVAFLGASVGLNYAMFPKKEQPAGPTIGAPGASDESADGATTTDGTTTADGATDATTEDTGAGEQPADSTGEGAQPDDGATTPPAGANPEPAPSTPPATPPAPAPEPGADGQ